MKKSIEETIFAPRFLLSSIQSHSHSLTPTLSLSLTLAVDSSIGSVRLESMVAEGKRKANEMREKAEVRLAELKRYCTSYSLADVLHIH